MRGGIAGLLRLIWVDKSPTEIKKLELERNRAGFGKKRRSYRSDRKKSGSLAAALQKNQAADSERKTRWKRGPVNWTPTSFSRPDWESQTWTTRPWVAKSASALRASAALPA